MDRSQAPPVVSMAWQRVPARVRAADGDWREVEAWIYAPTDACRTEAPTPEPRRVETGFRD